MTRQRGVVTDQAAVALVLARARVSGRQAHVVDLLIGLAEEPDGVAGRLLAERVSAVVALAAHPLPPRLAPLDVALSWAVAEAAPRPAGTGDLLAAALEVGGSDLADTLAAVGIAARDILPAPEPEGGYRHPRARMLDVWGQNLRPGPAAETLGLRSPLDPDPTLTLEAARAVAVTRAVAGGAVDLLVSVSASADQAEGALLSDPVDTIHALFTMLDRGVPESATDNWDRGLEAVLGVAKAWRTPEPATTDDLVRAAAVAGGAGPAALLAELARRRA